VILEKIVELVGRDTLEIFGPSGSGKTMFCIEVMKEALEQGYKVVFIDAERNINEDPQHENLKYYYRPTLDDILNVARNLPKAQLYILDSIGFPVVAAYANASMNERGSMLLKCISLTQFLKIATWKHNALAIVTNQPVSEFGKTLPPEELPPFGDKSKFGYKEIVRTWIVKQTPELTEISIKSWRSRKYGRGKELFKMKISEKGVDIECLI